MTPLEKLSSDNFLAVSDVAMDICEELQMSTNNNVPIPLIRNIVRFPNLLPAQSTSLMDKYGRFRRQGLEYLKEAGAIQYFGGGSGIRTRGALLLGKLSKVSTWRIRPLCHASTTP